MRTGRPWGTNRSFAYLNSWNYDSNHNTSQQPWCSSKIQETDRNSPQTENNRPSDDNQPVTILRHKWVHCLLGKFWSSKIWTRTMIRDAIDQQQSKLLSHSIISSAHFVQHTGSILGCLLPRSSRFALHLLIASQWLVRKFNIYCLFSRLCVKNHSFIWVFKNMPS